MIIQILLIVFYLTFPLVIIYLCKKWTILKKLGTIVLAYGFGLLIGTTGVLPNGSDGFIYELQGQPSMPKARLESLIQTGKAISSDRIANQIAGIQENIYRVAILLAFPLILFSLNIKKWLKHAKKGYVSVALAIVAGLVMVTAGFFIWKNAFPDTWKLAGMFEGIYTGGSPNFAALKLILNVDADRFVVLMTYDMIVGAGLILFFITVAPRIFRYFLPRFKEEDGISADAASVPNGEEELEDFSGMLKRKTLIPLLKAFGISLIIVAACAGTGLTLLGKYEQYQMAFIVLSITTLGILASLIKSVNKIQKTFQLGLYLILIFSLTVASQSDLETFSGKGVLDLILFITWCYFGSLFLHIILAKIFRIDADNFLITSAAFVFSPPFVPLVANALKNRDVIVTGITGGVIGYVLGNYLGTTLAYFLKGL